MEGMGGEGWGFGGAVCRRVHIVRALPPRPTGSADKIDRTSALASAGSARALRGPARDGAAILAVDGDI
jgi:hypothetical protein